MQTLTNKFKTAGSVPPPLPQEKSANSNKYTNLLSKIEGRAMQAACDCHPAAAEMFGEVITDPYINYHPSDSNLWIKLFLRCSDNYDLYARLFYIRGGGTVLVKDKYWGYKMRPVIGANGWENRNQYLTEAACLNSYKDKVIGMLKDIIM